MATKHAKLRVCPQQDLRRAIATEPPRSVVKSCRLDPEPCPATFDDVSPNELKRPVVFVNVVFFDAVRQATDDKEATIHDADSAGSVKDFLSFVLCYQVERVRVVDVNPRVGVAFRVVEFAKVDRHVELSVEEAEISVMIGDVNLLLDTAASVGLHQFGGEGPVD